MSSAIERVEGAEGAEGVSIETYLNSLSNEIVTLDVSYKGITSLPDLTRFKNLKKLICYKNNLTCLPPLPQNLQELYCSKNKLTCLPPLPPNLQELSCSNNKLTCLPPLPPNLETLSCFSNKLTCLPTCLPTLPPNLKILYCHDNPIWEIVNNGNSFFQIKKNIQILNNLRDLYYCLKFKKQLRKWLWEKVREKRAMEMYNPNYLVEKLSDEEEDLEKVLQNWN
jgi:hypothetical protein